MIQEAVNKSVQGFYNMKQYNPKTGELVTDTGWVENSIVNHYAMCMADLFEYQGSLRNTTPVMCIGVGSTPVTVADTKLVDEKFRVSTTVAKSTYEVDSGMFQDGSDINAVDITGVFEANAGIELTIKEIGIMWGKTADPTLADTGKLFSRRVITNGWDKANDLRSVFVYRLIFKEV